MQERGGRDDVAGAAADLDDDAWGVEREAGAPLLGEDVDEKEAVLRDANAEGVAGGGWVRAGEKRRGGRGADRGSEGGGARGATHLRGLVHLGVEHGVLDARHRGGSHRSGTDAPAEARRPRGVARKHHEVERRPVR